MSQGIKIQHQVVQGIEYKWCPKCQSWQTLDQFCRDTKASDQLKGRCKSCIKTYDKKQKPQYYAIHKAERQRYNQQYYLSETEEQKCKRLEWRHNNREKVYASIQRRNTQLQECKITYESLRTLNSDFNYCCAYCGCRSDTIDHVVPLSMGGKHNIQNILPACRSCNSKKYNKDMVQWFEQQDFFTQDRLDFIIAYLDSIKD